MVRRAGDRDAARARWRIGAPYAGHEVATLVLHPRRDAPAPPPATLPQQPAAHQRSASGRCWAARARSPPPARSRAP